MYRMLFWFWGKMPYALQNVYYKWPLRPTFGKWLLPNRVAYVKVLSGINRGVQLRLHLRDERRFWFGNYEPHVQAVLPSYVRVGDLVCVVGGHIGFFAIAAAELVGDRGKVVVFEPNPHLVQRLKEHVAMNGLEGCVSVEEIAVGDQDGFEAFSLSTAAIQGHLADVGTGIDGEVIQVRTVRLDTYFEAEAPSFFFIDAEHAEAKIVAGMTRILHEHRPTLLIEMHLPVTGIAAFEALRELGYDSKRLPDFKRVHSSEQLKYGHYVFVKMGKI